MKVRTYIPRSSGATITFDDNSVLELVYGGSLDIVGDLTNEQKLAIESHFSQANISEVSIIDPRYNTNSDNDHFKGSFNNLAELESVHPNAKIGDYADVDGGIGTDTIRYIWDESDNGWKSQISGTIPSATDTIAGLTTFATNSETILGVNSNKSITPKNLQSKVATGSEITTGATGRLLGSEVVINEDDMSSNSDERIPTQQSVKTYVDSVISSVPNAMQVPIQLDVNDAQSFPLPIAEVTGKSWIIINAHQDGTLLGDTNQIVVNSGDKIVVKNGIINSTNDGSDFVKYDNTDQVHSVNGKVGAVVINENKFHFAKDIPSRDSLVVKAGDSVFIEQIGQLQTTPDGTIWIEKSNQNGLLASDAEEKIDVTPFVPSSEYSRFSIVSTNSNTINISNNANPSNATVVYELNNQNSSDVDYVFSAGYKNIKGDNLGTVAVSANTKKYIIFINDGTNCFQISSSDVLTDNSIDGNGVTTPLSVALSNDDGQLASIGSDGKVLIKLDITQETQNARLDIIEAAIVAEEEATATTDTEQATQDNLIGTNASNIGNIQTNLLAQDVRISNNETALNTEIASTDAEQIVQNGLIAGNTTALNTEIASTDAEQIIQDGLIAANTSKNKLGIDALDLDTTTGDHFKLSLAGPYTISGTKEIIEVFNTTNSTIDVEGNSISALSGGKLTKSGSVWSKFFASFLLVVLLLVANESLAQNAVKLRSYTDSDRDALTLSVDERRLIYNNDNSKVQLWDGDSWESISNKQDLTSIYDGVLVKAADDWTDGIVTLNGANAIQSINTGVDLNEVDQLIIHMDRVSTGDSADSNNGFWNSPQAIIDLNKFNFDVANGGLITTGFSDDFIALRINTADKTAGILQVYSLGTTNSFNQRITCIEFKKKAVGVSNRVGMREWGPSGRTPNEGYLAMTGIVVNGAIDYPIAAQRNPLFVSGDDFDFTKYEGAFVRNLGGNAANEGTLQQDQQARSPNNPVNTQVNGGGGQTVRFVTTNNETRPVNVAEQLYLIVDTYLDVITWDQVGATLEINQSPTVNGNSAVFDGTITTNGNLKTLRFKLEHDRDEATIYDLAALVPTGSVIVASSYPLTDNVAHECPTEVSFIRASDTAIQFNRLDAIDDICNYWVEVTFKLP